MFSLSEIYSQTRKSHLHAFENIAFLPFFTFPLWHNFRLRKKFLLSFQKALHEKTKQTLQVVWL